MMFDLLATTIQRFRWPLLAGLLLVTVLAGTVAKDIRFDFSPRSLFLTTDDEVVFLEAHRDQFGDEDALFMLLVEATDVFQPEVLRAVSELSERVEVLPHIEGVFSLSTVQEIERGPLGIQVQRLLEELPEDEAASQALRERTVSNPLFLRRFVNSEGTATAILCKFDNGFVEELERRPVLAQVEELLDSFRSDQLEVTLVGLPVVNREYAVLLQSDMARTIAASVVLLALLLYVLFRNPYSVLLPVVAVIVAVAWTVAFMVLTDDYFNIINCVIPTLLLVIGVGDAVHFLTAYYQEIGAGTNKDNALRAMVVRVGGACLLTSVTAAVGFASLIVARIDIIKGMGQVAAVGLMASYVAVLVLLPAVLSLVPSPTAGVRADPSEGRIGALLVWLGRVTVQRKALICGLTLVLCLLSALGAMRVQTDNFLLEELLPGNPVSRALHHTEEVLTGVMPSEISIRTDEDGGVLEPEVLRGMERIQRHLSNDAFVGHSFSLADLVKELAVAMDGERRIPDSRDKVAQYLLAFEMSEDPSFIDSVVDGSRRVARISASQRDWGTENFFAWYDGSGQCDSRSARCADPPAAPILDAIDEAFGTVDGRRDGLEVRVTGGNLVAARALSRVVDDMMWSLATAFVVISLLMMVLLGSLRIGLLAMVPNVIPLLVTLGFMGWAGIPLRTATALIFSISLGVAVHDTIHFLTRYREELLATRDREEALRRTLLTTGRAIIFTSLLLVGGFLIMMTTRFVGIFQMGLLGAITLLAAMVGALVLLPVCLLLFKPWSRWVEKASD